MDKPNYCLHTHTFRCGHAVGQDEDYVLNAIKSGLKYLGFSDHCILPNYTQPGMRGSWLELDNYFDSIKNLKNKYRNQIKIFTGFECEYMPQFVDYYRNLLNQGLVDYLILGQHMYLDQYSRVVWYMNLGRTFAIKQYTEDLIKGMATGLFAYVAHPDLFMCFTNTWGELEIEASKKIIAAATKYNIPLEINLCRARVYGKVRYDDGNNYYQYPFVHFWEMVAKSKVKVVIGLDAHRPIDVYEPGLDVVEYIVNSAGVRPIYKLELNEGIKF